MTGKHNALCFLLWGRIKTVRNRLKGKCDDEYGRRMVVSVLRQRIWANSYRCVAYGTMRCRLQQLTEFDCFVKSFAYLAARLPRSDLIEPFLDEAIVEPLDQVQKQFEIMKKAKELQMSDATFGVTDDAFMAGMKMATGKPPEADLPAKDVPLSEGHPDVYPCLLAMCGSGFAFYKVML